MNGAPLLSRVALVGIALGVVMSIVLPGTAEAHVFPGMGDFFSGMLHPVTSLEMLLPLVALGALAGQQERDAALRVLAALPIAVLFGGAIGVALDVGPDVTILGVILMAVLGICVAGAWRLPIGVVTGIAVLVGLVVGLDNAVELTSAVSPLRFFPGVALVGLLLVAYTMGLVRWLKWEWTRIAVRVVGSWIAAAGIMVLALGR